MKMTQNNYKKEKQINGIPYENLELFARNIYPYILKDIENYRKNEALKKSTTQE